MKTLARIKIVILILFITVIIFASFLGIYKKEDFRVVNIIKNYKLGMQFTDAIEFKGTIKPDTKTILDSEGNIIEDDGSTEYSEENGYTVETTTVNDKEILNIKNYKLTKKILKNRLKDMGIGEYKISLNKENGEITIKLQENENVHKIEDYLLQKGDFKIIDKETEEVLLDNSNVKSAKVVYAPSQEDNSYTIVYLQINFNKEGTKKLEEISQIYVEDKTTDKTDDTENTESEQNSNIKYVSAMLDNDTLSSTYFGEKISTGTLNIPLTQASDYETLLEKISEVNNLATVINNGNITIEYEFNENELQPKINSNTIYIIIASCASILLVGFIIITIKFKLKGLISSFTQIGYLALLLLTIRYTNVIVTLYSIVAIGLSAILNYIFNYVMLNDLKKNNTIGWEIIKKFAFYTILVYLIAIVLTFNSITSLNSFGMTLFWGSMCIYLYNLSITKTMLKKLNK